ncbi:hypothetical protein F2Q68_00008261 [Brassica cretica]|uniref:Uncharacterized protein n=1 Tax=Brassica cretica TaxID=69181 RepID=A0A8S9KRQ4_BRACR|nr:hypothetical protein F2Q68_00008261 [Brassica cretica]
MRLKEEPPLSSSVTTTRGSSRAIESIRNGSERWRRGGVTTNLRHHILHRPRVGERRRLRKTRGVIEETKREKQSHRGSLERRGGVDETKRERRSRRGSQDRSVNRRRDRQRSRAVEDRKRNADSSTRPTEKRSRRGDRHSRRFDRERRRLISSTRDTVEEKSAPRRDHQRDSMSSRIRERKREDDPSRERERLVHL